MLVVAELLSGIFNLFTVAVGVGNDEIAILGQLQRQALIVFNLWNQDPVASDQYNVNLVNGSGILLFVVVKRQVERVQQFFMRIKLLQQLIDAALPDISLQKLRGALMQLNDSFKVFREHGQFMWGAIRTMAVPRIGFDHLIS